MVAFLSKKPVCHSEVGHFSWIPFIFRLIWSPYLLGECICVYCATFVCTFIVECLDMTAARTRPQQRFCLGFFCLCFITFKQTKMHQNKRKHDKEINERKWEKRNQNIYWFGNNMWPHVVWNAILSHCFHMHKYLILCPHLFICHI